LTTLLEFDVVPIINENDTVATEEIVFGDNDTLAAVVAKLIGADLLIILSDVDGLYTAPPEEPGAQKISLVEEITPDIEISAGGSGSSFGTGGMHSKITAAKIGNRSRYSNDNNRRGKSSIYLRCFKGVKIPEPFSCL